MPSPAYGQAATAAQKAIFYVDFLKAAQPGNIPDPNRMPVLGFQSSDYRYDVVLEWFDPVSGQKISQPFVITSQHPLTYQEILGQIAKWGDDIQQEFYGIQGLGPIPANYVPSGYLVAASRKN